MLQNFAQGMPAKTCRLAAIALALLSALAGAASAIQVSLQDGRVLKGKLGKVSGMAEAPQGAAPDGAGPLQLIVFLDDDLRRTFFPQRQVREVAQEAGGEAPEKFDIRQRALQQGRTVKVVGNIVRVTPFDEYGRRTFTMSTTQGKIDIVQGITEITPEWTKVAGLTHVWDMRMATSSIPRDALGTILMRQCKKGDVEDRKKVARFYLQCERYEEANKELLAVLAEHPDDAKLKEELSPSIAAIRQLAARRLLSELELRRKAGQHKLVLERLRAFPAEGAAGETLQAVREMVQDYEGYEKLRAGILAQIDQFAGQVTDVEQKKRIKPVRDEIAAELSLNTMDRMAAFREMAGDAAMQPSEKVALAIHGWLLGSKGANNTLSSALSLWGVRRVVREYLSSSDKLSRAKLFEQFQSEQAASVDQVAQLVAAMKPPIETPPLDNPALSYEMEVPGLGDSPAVRYLVQLPPEYDPYRRYPTVVSLHGASVAPEQQIDWWAGAPGPGGTRLGQATRQGYIVIAPEWAAEHQKQYGYSAREHAAVLDSLRDACRRFSIDTDRVFLSGHSMGGDAAWDIGIAHPDLWAGVIPFVAKSDRYTAFYSDNARLLPLYFVAGELDGGKTAANSREWDRYMADRGYNCTVVEYLGRGHEHFSDEVLRVFDWMNRLRRNFFPREFKSTTMRPWDNFFWWVELRSLPNRSMIDPGDWPPPRGTQPVDTKASVTKTGGIYIATGAGQLTVWLSPELLPLDRRVSIVVNGHRIGTPGKPPVPDLEVLLEDVRTRVDRQHPFWAKVETGTGRTTGKP